MDHQDETDHEKNTLQDFDSSDMKLRLNQGAPLKQSDRLNNNTYMGQLIKSSFEERSNQNSMVN